jgi:hypothetical protein
VAQVQRRNDDPIDIKCKSDADYAAHKVPPVPIDDVTQSGRRIKLACLNHALTVIPGARARPCLLKRP